MDIDLVKFTLLLAGVVFVVGFVTFGIVIIFAFRKDPAKTTEMMSYVWVGGQGLRMMTVLLVITAASLLVIIDKMNDGILALMSAIIGYVLGGLRQERGVELPEEVERK